jgi:hypothetical protein
MPLAFVRDDIHLYTRRLIERGHMGASKMERSLAHFEDASACCDAGVQPTVDKLLQVAFQSLPKVLVHC